MIRKKAQKVGSVYTLLILGMLSWLGLSAWAQETDPLYEEKYLLPPLMCRLSWSRIKTSTH